MFTIIITNIVSEFGTIPALETVATEYGYNNTPRGIKESIELCYQDNIMSFTMLGMNYTFNLETERYDPR